MSKWFTRFSICIVLLCGMAKAQTANPNGAINIPATNSGGTITALTGDVTASGVGSVAATVVNIPTTATMAGKLTATAIAAPATPAAGKGAIYVDSTSKNIAVKDDTGVVKHGIQDASCGAGTFVSAISAAGVSTCGTPSGGGATRGLFSALPAAGSSSGQTYFSTDAGLLSESNGSTWFHTYANIFGVSPTTTSVSSTWFNENAGAAQATVANTSSGAGVILTSGSNSGYSTQARTQTYPSTPFTYVICGQAALGTQFSEIGILATDGTKAVTFGVNMVGAAAATSQIQYGKATNATTFSAAYAPSPNFPTVVNHTGPLCFAESDNGSVRKVRYSFNKTDWLSAGFSDAITSTDFLTATAIGYYVNSGNSQGIVKYQIFSEEVVASALF